MLLVMMTSCVSDDGTGAESLIGTGDCIPAFTLQSDGGEEVSTASLTGHPYILNFFDTGCPDCRQELAVLQRVYDKYGTTVPVLNVPRSQTEQEVAVYWNDASLSMPFYMPQDKALYYKFATSGIPRTYVVDGQGQVLAAYDDSPTADFDTIDGMLSEMVEAPAGDVMLSMRLKVASGSGPADELYFSNEYAVSYLEVWLFDAETKRFYTKLTAHELQKDASLSAGYYDATYLFDARVHAGVYDIFAIANYAYSPARVQTEDQLLNMIDSVTYQAGIEANMPDTGPVMTNRATSQLAVDLVPWINKKYLLTVDLERVVAKVQIGVSQNSFPLLNDGLEYAHINITNYKFVNLNKRYYLFQHKDSLSVLGPQPEFTMPSHFSDYGDEGEQYVVDPFFYAKTKDARAAATFGERYQSWYGAFTTEHFASMPSAGNYGYAYVLENTMFKTCQLNGYTPGIVFKGAVNPALVYLYDNSRRMLVEESRPEYWPQTLYLYNHQFYGSIQALNVGSGMSLDELVTYTDKQLMSYGIKQCKFNMGVYETYYIYWISHRNAVPDEIEPMEYGIVRNNFYRIVVTGVHDLGSSIVAPEIMRDNS